MRTDTISRLGRITIATPGLYTIPPLEYHADPVVEPSLSASIARVLLDRSPRHAWWAHPRLNPAFRSDHDDKFDLGTAAHAYLLEGQNGIVTIDADDWRTRAAREARDAARGKGTIALLVRQWSDVQVMGAVATQQLSDHLDPPRPLSNGTPEVTLVWQERDVWCRARLDWLHEDHKTVDDYKTTAGSANPDAWTRGSLFGLGYDVQAAFYLRGVKAVFGVEADFRFVVQEASPPYALSVIGLAPSVLQLAHAKVAYAIDRWRDCLASDRWPGYPAHTCYAEAPPWEETRWAERTWRDVPAPSQFTMEVS